jgi:superoxide dismutase, Fe-Mn family
VNTGVQREAALVRSQEAQGLSERLIVSHWENNYGGAVRRLNAITAQLAVLDFATAPVFVINGLKREELIATNSMILHELYFDGLGDGGAPDTALREALTRDFGSLDRWRSRARRDGETMGGGSGWVLLTYSHRDRRLVNQWAADHTHSMAGGTPILALDVRALLPHRLRCGRREIRRRVHGQHQLGERRTPS